MQLYASANLFNLTILTSRLWYNGFEIHIEIEEESTVKKLLLVASLAALTVLSASAFAQDVPASEKSVQANEVGKRVKREVVYGAYNEHATGNTRGNSYETTVDVQGGYGHGKLYVQNDGQASVSVTLEREYDNKATNLQGHASGSTSMVIIPAGESRTVYTNSPTGTGEHRLQLSSSNAPLDATFSYKSSNDKKHLN
jgi:hypothetical protein